MGTPFTLPATDAMLTMAPSLRSSMPGSTARMVRIIELTLRFDGEVEIVVLHLEDRAGMDEAGAVEQHVDPADLGDGGRRHRHPEHVEPARRDARLAGEFRKQRLVDVGGVHRRTGAREGQRAGAAYALGGRGQQHDLALQTGRHRNAFRSLKGYAFRNSSTGVGRAGGLQSWWNTSSIAAHHSPSLRVASGSWHGMQKDHQRCVVGSAAILAMSAAKSVPWYS